MTISNKRKTAAAALLAVGSIALIGAGTGANFSENHYGNYQVTAGTLLTQVFDASDMAISDIGSSGVTLTAPVGSDNLGDNWTQVTKLTIKNVGTLQARVSPASISAAPHTGPLTAANTALATQLNNGNATPAVDGVYLSYNADGTGPQVGPFTLDAGASQDVYLVAKTPVGGLTNAAQGGRAYIQFQYTTAVA